jgi:hypothetical protein
MKESSMKKIYNIRILLMVCLMASFGFLTSCDNDDEASDNGQVTLLSFGPTGAMHGENIKFIGRNLNKVESIALPNATVTKDQFVSQTADMIELTIPDAATEGLVVLNVTGSDPVTSKTALSFEVPVSITSFTPEAKPGTNITISGEFVNWIESVIFPGDIEVTEFVSASLNELVVTVPMEAKSGQLVFFTGGTEPLEIASEGDLVVFLPVITGLAPNPVERGAELTITGTNLDVAAGIRFKGDIFVTQDEFVSVNETTIVLTVPMEINKGTITAVAFSGEETESPEPLALVGDLPPLAALTYAFYTDAIENGWGNWGWGGPVDFNNADNVRDGQKAIKKTYDGSWDALRFGGGSVSTAGKTKLVFSIYGDAGTSGKKVQLILNEQWSSPSYIHTIVEGEWNEVVLDLATIGAPATITDILWQAQGWSGTIFVDHVGFR